uniref:Uncharacterized protein n=1 Tax=Arundo donax TaxID=35708 RepID=A0A0A9H4J4_ARUDO
MSEASRALLVRNNIRQIGELASTPAFMDRILGSYSSLRGLVNPYQLATCTEDVIVR